MAKIKVEWAVSDGFVGNARHTLEIDTRDYESMSVEEIKDAISDAVDNDFQQKVMPYCDLGKYAQQVHATLEIPTESEG